MRTTGTTVAHLGLGGCLATISSRAVRRACASATHLTRLGLQSFAWLLAAAPWVHWGIEVMGKMTRKDFLRLSAATAAATALPGSAGAQQTGGSQTRVQGSSAKNTLIRGADLLTMDTRLGELTGTDVLINDGKIAAIGRNLSVGEAEVIDGRGMILMPGMVDGHRHLWETIDMGRLTKFNPTEYSKNYLQWRMRAIVSMTPEDQYLASLIGSLQAIDSGVTSVLDYAHGQHTPEHAMAAARGVKDSGIAGWFGLQLGVAYSFKPGDTVKLADIRERYQTAPTDEQWRTADRLQKELFSDSSAPLQLALGPRAHSGSKLGDLKAEWQRLRGMGVKLLIAHMHKPENRSQRVTWGIAIPAFPICRKLACSARTITSRTPIVSLRKN